MFGSTILEVMIGLVFIYIVLGVFNTAAIELLVRMMKLRSKTLADGIKTLVRDEDLRKSLYKHPLIKSLSKSGMPSYVPARDYAVALIDTVQKAGKEAKEYKALLEDLLGQVADPALRGPIDDLLTSGQEGYDKLKEGLESAFDSTMDRVSGWYARKTQTVGLVVACIVVILLNADTVMIFKAISTDEVLREQLVASAEVANADNSTLDAQIQSIEFPLGWSFEKQTSVNRTGLPVDAEGIINKVLGLIVSAVAVSLGASFWFQILNRLVGIRQGIRASGPGAAPKEATT